MSNFYHVNLDVLLLNLWLKPDKFGIKFWLLCDVKSKYICNGYPYLGADSNRNLNDLIGESVVKKLIESFYNKGYFVTTDKIVF
jgi:hypothetical protein